MSESPEAERPTLDAGEQKEDAQNNDGPPAQPDLAADLSDNESDLSDLADEEEAFKDFDIDAMELGQEQEIDADNLRSVTAKKRERKEGEEPRRKKRSGRREEQLQKKSRRRRGEDDEVTGDGAEIEGGRRGRRKAAEDGVKRVRKVREVTPDDQLDDEERIRRRLERDVQNIIKKPSNRSRRAAGDDLAKFMDDEINQLRSEMADAARLDTEARQEIPPRVAMHKLKLLPKVTAMLNRNGREAEAAIIDPDNNLMESVKFFLEPLNDGSLPAYNIQRELFTALVRLPIGKETLIASGIGKVVLFYTKSKKPELAIKRMAERLLAEWTRPILKRSDDYRNRQLQEVEYDPLAAEKRAARAGPADKATLAARARAKALARPSQRARIENPELKQYTIVPRSNIASIARRRKE